MMTLRSWTRRGSRRCSSKPKRPEVGAVGPQLLYPDRRVQHAGMFLASVAFARHAFRHAAEDDPGYFGLALRPAR